MSPTVAALALSLVCAAPRVEVAATACADARAVEAALAEAGVDAPLRVRLDDAAPGVLSLRVTVADIVIVERTLAVAPQDCPHLPRLVAGIVRRRLDELPRETWDPPPPPQPAPPPPGLAWRWSGAVGLGAAVATGPLAARWLLAGGVTGRRARLVVDARLAAHLRPAIALGAGDAHLAGLAVEGGAGVALGGNDLVVTPLARLAAGAQLAWGSGYPRDARVVLPLADALAGVRLAVGPALFGEVLARLSLARARLVAPGGVDTEPPVRLEVILGLAF